MSTSSRRGIGCPDCGCTRLPALRTVRQGDAMIRIRCCVRCGRTIRTSERISGITRQRPRANVLPAN